MAELEELKEMSEELEHNQSLVEKKLRSDLCTLWANFLLELRRAC